MLLSIRETENKRNTCFLFHIETESKRNRIMFMLLFHIETESKRKCYHVIVTVSHRNRKQTQIVTMLLLLFHIETESKRKFVTMLLLLFHIETESKHKKGDCYCYCFT